MPQSSIPRIKYLRVRNYRILRDLELKNITPLTAFLGPNGSGKSTLFDALAFLTECFQFGLQQTWRKHGGIEELRSHNISAAISFDIRYQEPRSGLLMTYHLAINEVNGKPFVEREWLERQNQWTEQPQRFLNFSRGEGWVIPGEMPEDKGERFEERFNSADLIAANTLGQFAKHPHLSTLRQFVLDWYVANLNTRSLYHPSESGLQEHLSSNGDNIANVIEYLKEQHPDRLQEINHILAARIPQLESVETASTFDRRLLLQIKDTPSQESMPADTVSHGTLMMLAYLLILNDPNPRTLIAIDEPENFLHPRLMIGLAEKFRSVSAHSQVFIATHSPYFVDALRPEELWILYRDADGFARARRATDMRGIKEFTENGAQLGQLWMENFFEVGDPLIISNRPK
jgi:predicted ATPase